MELQTLSDSAGGRGRRVLIFVGAAFGREQLCYRRFAAKGRSYGVYTLR